MNKSCSFRFTLIFYLSIIQKLEIREQYIVVGEYALCTPLRNRIIVAVNVDRKSDLQIFSVMLSELSYPRTVVMPDLIVGLLISISYHV